MADKKISIGIIGFGGRGKSMAKASVPFSDKVYINAVAEPAENRRRDAIEIYNVPEENVFSDYKDFLAKGVIADLLFITTMDTMHYEPLMMALDIGYKYIVLEKPISTDINECIEMAKKAKEKNANVIILHSMRYNVFYRKMKELVESGEIGEVMNVRHIEGASLMNYSHSFVRGNFANTERSAPFITQKSCHDMDILTYVTGLKYKKIFAFGGLSYFVGDRAPEGSAERCIDCKYKNDCRFSGFEMYTKSYHQPWIDGAVHLHGYPNLEEAMAKGQYGRCVWKCDNNVMDHQAITFEFENGGMGTFTLTAFDGGRKTEIIGTHGVMYANESTGVIEIHGQIGIDNPKIFDTKSTAHATIDHYNTDILLMSELIAFINEGDSTNLSFIEGAVHSHFACFAAEISREEERVVYINSLTEDK